MNILGIIAEYNPFHNGHMYHINQAKVLCNAEYVICVISGNFIQRGEPAIINKWARTSIVLNYGIDLVIELPFVYSMSSAEYFSYAAVKLLDSIGIVTHICFGSECGNIDQLKVISDILYEQPANYRKFLKENLSKGLSFPAARELSVKKYIKETLPEDYEELKNIIKTSNNILGLEYLKALRKLNSKIIPSTIKRIGSSYNEQSVADGFSSATSIRKLLMSNKLDNNALKILNTNLPSLSLQTIIKEITNGRGPVSSADFDSIAVWEFRKCSIEILSEILYVSEGFENRLKNASHKVSTIQQLIENSSTKRFTKTRIQRAIFNTLIGLNREDFDFFNKFGGPQYIRILGFNQRGRYLLSINKTSSLPVFVNFPQLYKTCNTQIKKMLDYEILATNLYVLAYKNPDHCCAGQDFTNGIVVKN